MATIAGSASASRVSSEDSVHPRWVRIVHWINALTFMTMLFSGWQIYKADPYWSDLPDWWPTLGGDLPGALQWHFAAMWVLAANGAVAVFALFASGRFARLYTPADVSRLASDLKALVTGHAEHDVVNERSAVQRLAYLGVMVLLLLEIVSGLSIWKPVQLHWLTDCLGGYESARRVHLVGMAILASFATGHVLLALAAPRLLFAMLGIRRTLKESNA